MLLSSDRQTTRIPLPSLELRFPAPEDAGKPHSQLLRHASRWERIPNLPTPASAPAGSAFSWCALTSPQGRLPGAAPLGLTGLLPRAPHPFQRLPVDPAWAKTLLLEDGRKQCRAENAAGHPGVVEDLRSAPYTRTPRISPRNSRRATAEGCACTGPRCDGPLGVIPRSFPLHKQTQGKQKRSESSTPLIPQLGLSKGPQHPLSRLNQRQRNPSQTPCEPN